MSGDRPRLAVLAMIAADLAVIALGLLSAQALGYPNGSGSLWPKAFVLAAVTLLALYLADLYQLDFRIRRLELASRLLLAIVASSTMTAAIGFALPALGLGRIAFIHTFGVIALGCIATRLVWPARRFSYKRQTGETLISNLRPSWLIFSDGFVKTEMTRVVKRAMDIGLALMGLVLSLPLMLLAACAIKLDSKGPVLFRQRRVGERGRIFVLRKFRSMTVDAERDGPVWAAVDDSRVTRVGRWLRRTRLDELPQFWNVLTGDMSFFDRSWIFRP